MNGIEITAQREQEVLFSIPYYIYTEQLVVRREEAKIRDISDLKGKKVGTLSGPVAQDTLKILYRSGGDWTESFWTKSFRNT